MSISASGRAARASGMATRPSRSRCSPSRRWSIAALALFLVYQFATYRGLPIVLVVMGLLIGAVRLRHQAHDDRPPHLRDGRQHQGGAALGHQDRAADAAGVRQHGRAVGARRPDHRRAPGPGRAGRRPRQRARRHRRRVHRRRLGDGRRRPGRSARWSAASSWA